MYANQTTKAQTRAYPTTSRQHRRTPNLKSRRPTTATFSARLDCCSLASNVLNTKHGLVGGRCTYSAPLACSLVHSFNSFIRSLGIFFFSQDSLDTSRGSPYFFYLPSLGTRDGTARVCVCVSRPQATAECIQFVHTTLESADSNSGNESCV
jgi:hypothetical protein